jgi:hypothetical protein
MDSEPALDPHQEQLDRLRDFGYNGQEARFLYLAATHSGYFTRHQFLSFTHQTKGCLVHRFTTKLLTQHHARATQYGHKTSVFKLTSRTIYDLICRRLLSAWHEDHIWSVTTVITAIRNPGIVDRYHTSGSAVMQVGWKVLDLAPPTVEPDRVMPA